MNIEICADLAMPFFPMRPTRGRALQRPAIIKELWHEAIELKHWVMQPKLNGDRVCLAVVDGKVYTQNRHGGCYRFRVGNAKDFLALPNRTCFDGEVFKGDFYPFELLVCNAVSFLRAEARERARLAKDMAKYLRHPWLFDTPSRAWLARRGANRPIYDGVVLKKATSAYLQLGSASQSSAGWFKHLW